MAVRNGLPFEFPWRWPDVRSRFGLDDDATSLMDERDRELEDHLGGLGGTAVEAFRGIHGGATSIAFEIDATVSDSYSTSGVSMTATGDALISVGGLWNLSVVQGIQTPITASAPTSGRVDMWIRSYGFGNPDKTATLSASDLADAGVGVTIYFGTSSDSWYDPDDTSHFADVVIQNNTDSPLDVMEGHFTGHSCPTVESMTYHQ